MSTRTSRTFLDLPLEIRGQIYDHIIPTCRLAPFPYLDPDWSMKVPHREYRGIPDFVYTCTSIYEEAIPLIYDRATLEVAPAQHSMNYFEIGLGNTATDKIIPYSYTRISNTLRFYRREHLKLIRKAHVYSNQGDVIDGQSYEALLQWLVENTGVDTIHLSARPMTRIRGRAGFDMNLWRDTFCCAGMARNLRLVRIWTRSKRPPWEYEKIMRLRCRVTDGTLNPCQLYFWSLPDGSRGREGDEGNGVGSRYGLLQLDPRWLTRLNDEQAKIDAMEMAAPMIDQLMGRVLVGRELKDYKDTSRHGIDDAWVCQMILVAQ